MNLTLGHIVAVTSERITVETNHGRVVIARALWTSPRLPHRGMPVQLNRGLEARIEPARTSFTLAECLEGAKS